MLDPSRTESIATSSALGSGLPRIDRSSAFAVEHRDLLEGRPALFALLALISGIVLERRFSHVDLPIQALYGHTPQQIVLFGFFGLLLFLQGAILSRLHLRSKIVTLFGLLFFLGFFSSALLDASYLDSPLVRIAACKQEHVVIRGTILRPITPTGQSAFTICSADTIEAGSVHLPISGDILVTLINDSTSGQAPLEEGDRVALYGQLEPFTGIRNPHEYPRDAHLRDRYRVEAQITLLTHFDYQILDSVDRISMWQRVLRLALRARTKAQALLAEAIHDPPTLSFVEAVVLGERTDLSEETLTDFTRSGVSHILAVSGFNVAIVAASIAQLLRLLGLRRRALRTALAMLGVAIYCLIVGLEPSVVRAFLMIQFYFIARFVERKPDALNIACSAALLTLLFRPFDLFDAGFQLSYTAVIGIAILYPEMRRLLHRQSPEAHPWRSRASEVLMLSLAATIATLPVTVLQFHRLSVVGTIANIPVIPLASIITSIGFLVIPITALSAPIGRLYGEVVQYLTRLLLLLTHASAHLPSASIPASLLLGVGVLLAAISSYYVVRASTWKHIPLRLLISGLAIATVLSIVPLDASVVEGRAELSILFFDVGQGDCILLHGPAGHTYLIDFGGISSSNISKAERIVSPFLQAEGINTIDAAYITHMHIDHYGGAPYLLENEPIQTLYWTGEHVNNKIAKDLDSVIMQTSERVRRVSAGDVFHLEPDFTLYVLHPPHVLVDQSGPTYGQNLNNGSLAIKVVYKKESFLLLGDIEGLDERLLVRRYGEFLKSDVVKVAHHGSRTSSTTEFIHETSPTYAVISVGEHNRYGHPAPLTIHRWDHSGATVCRTDRDGAILIRSDGESVWRDRWDQ